MACSACLGRMAQRAYSIVMPGLVPGIHVFLRGQDVNGRDKPGHDGLFRFQLRPFHPGFRGKVDGAVPADVVKMPVKEFSRRALAGAVQ